MNSKQIMELVDTYVSACVELESENNNYGTAEASSISFMDRARAKLVAEIEDFETWSQICLKSLFANV